MRQCGEDLNTVSIFFPFTSVMAFMWFWGMQTGLFSAVTNAFIVNIQVKLGPDFQEMSYDLLKVIANVSWERSDWP